MPNCLRKKQQKKPQQNQNQPKHKIPKHKTQHIYQFWLLPKVWFVLFIHEGLALYLASQQRFFLNINFNSKSFNSLLHFHIH